MIKNLNNLEHSDLSELCKPRLVGVGFGKGPRVPGRQVWTRRQKLRQVVVLQMALAVFLFVYLLTPITQAQIECVPDETLPVVFAGKAQNIRVTFHNRDAKPVQVGIRTRLFQASSSSVMPLGEAVPWKKLEVLGHQTAIETFSVSCPSIKVATRFQIQWMDNQGAKLGTTDMIACPEDALHSLKTFAGDHSIGIWDPSGKIKPLFQSSKLEVEDLEAGPGLDVFRGRLAILGPFSTNDTMPSHFRENVKKMVERGVGVIWIQPFSEATLSASATRLGTGVLVLARPAMISSLAETPISQLRLIDLARVATDPETILSESPINTQSKVSP